MKNINQIVAVGSIDGILTTAALLRLIGNLETPVVFCQAFTVDKIDVSAWLQNRQVAFVDLAVNNRDKPMTKAFVERIEAAGHKIVAICDEHSREDWAEVLGSFEALEFLLIQPQSQAEGKFKSSGAVLMNALADNPQLATSVEVLCLSADRADAMHFDDTGSIVNEAVKSNIADDRRRVYLARYYADPLNSGMDSTIRTWVDEYKRILLNHELILEDKRDLGNGMVRVNAVGRAVDMTTLMSKLYKDGARVVVLEGEIFDKAAGAKVRMVSFGTSEKIDLLACVKQVVPTASGFAQKVNVRPEDEAVALEAVRAILK